MVERGGGGIWGWGGQTILTVHLIYHHFPQTFFSVFSFLSAASLFSQSAKPAEGCVAMRWAQREPAAWFFQSPISFLPRLLNSFKEWGKISTAINTSHSCSYIGHC